VHVETHFLGGRVTRDAGSFLTASDDYASGAMLDAEAEAFEVELFARAAAGDTAENEFLERLRRAAEWIARRGAFNVGSTRAEVEALRGAGIKIAYQEFGSGGYVEIAPLPAGTELYIYRVGVDLRGYDDVDVVIESPDGQHVKTFRDVRYDPIDGAIYGVCEAPLAEISFRRGRIVSKVLAGRGAERELVARYEMQPVG
jgi:hypothetical protein